jgi:predicted cytidylate kinase
MDVVAFSRFAEGRPEVDEELDRRMIERARAGDVLLDARLSGWHAAGAGVPALRVLLAVRPEVATQQVAGREGRADVDKVQREHSEREASETRRYRDLYGFDPTNRSHYDLVIDASALAAEEIAHRVVQELHVRKLGAGIPGDVPKGVC